MTVELLVSPPASGKTETCIQHVLGFQKTHPFDRIWVVVPDRLQSAAFRKRLALSGGSLGTQVGRFNDLFNSILEENGIHVPRVTYPLTHHLIKDVVNQLVKEGNLPYFSALQEFPGFIQTLRECFTDLKRAMVDPQAFLQFAQNGRKAHQELALLYQMYQEKLQSLNYADEEDINTLTVKKLNDGEFTCENIKLLILDGFDSFTGAQFEVLKLLANQVGTLLITFPGEYGSKRQAHQRFRNNIERLMTELSPTLLPGGEKSYLPTPISHIEKHLFNNEETSPVPVNNPILLEARSPADEVREVMRWVKKLVIREKLPISDCVIFTPNPAAYHPLFRLYADEFGIPLRFTLDESLNQSQPITALINLLSLPLKNYNAHHLLNCLRSPYFNFGINLETIDLLELISRVGQIVEGQTQWQETFSRLIDSTDQDMANLEDERHAPKLPRGDLAGEYQNIVDSIFEQVTPPSDSLSLTDWITWLEDLLERLDFFLRTDNERDQTAIKILREVFRSLILVESVKGIRPSPYDEFVRDLNSTLQNKGTHEPQHRNRPELLIARMTEARGVRFKSVAILGLSEGSFPANEQPDPFLDEELRLNLGLEPRLNREQAGLFYQAVTRADQYLLITRPYLSDDGEAWEESAYWRATKKLFDQSAVVRINPEQPLPLSDTASSQELLFEAVRTSRQSGQFKELPERWHNLQQVRDVLQARRVKHANSRYEGDLSELAEVINQRYPSEHIWSASRLEAFSNCPYRFYVSNLLELEKRELPKLGLDSSQLGSLLHKIMENTYLNTANRTNLDDLLQTLEAECDREFADAPRTYGFRPSALWQIEQEQFRKSLRETIIALTEFSDWQPVHFEAKFGIGQQAPLTIELESEPIHIRGVVDRIDRSPEGALRVIDYKTGSTHLSPNDLKLGYRLQLPIYALAARDALQLGEVIDGIYWKIMQAEPSSLRLERFSNNDVKGFEVALAALLTHLERILAGIRSAEFPPQPPQGGCPDYCPATQWCWRYTPGW